jgi:hypothetical protein
MWGSGRIVTREYPLSGFTSIRAAAFDIEVSQSDKHSVTVRADDNIIDRLIVRKSGSALVLGKRPWFWNIGPFTLEATITMPTLEGLELSGGARADLADFRRIGSVDVLLSGASELRGKIETDSADFDASGASRAILSGSARRISIEASGASKLDLEKMAAVTAVVALSGASRARLNVTSTIESIEASGASTLRYLGDPALGHIDSSGASRIARV